MPFTCFISYSWDNEKHKLWVEKLASALQQGFIDVIYDQNKNNISLGNSITQFIENGIETSDFVLLVCTDKYVEKANKRIKGVGYEIEIIAADLLNGNSKGKYIPIFRGCHKLPSCIKGINGIDFSDDNLFNIKIKELLKMILPLGLPIDNGIAPRDVVFGEEDLPGQVFNIELLSKPIIIKKNLNRTCITVNRSEVYWAIYNRKGRDAINKQAFPNQEAQDKAIDLDNEITKFLLTAENGEEHSFYQQNMRWASGAVLPIVEYRNREWVPFFFRDIPPYGWQLPQGASENKTDNLDDPWSFIMREFLEEVLVCSIDPTNQRVLKHPFYFDRTNLEKEINDANQLTIKHEKLRYERDNLIIKGSDPIYASIIPTNVQLSIYKSCNDIKDLRNVLVLFNITELGIEVIKVIRFNLLSNQFILDGEIFEPAQSNQVELIRTPVALISLDYLEQSFKTSIEYVFNNKYDNNLPSIMGPKIESDQIHLFHDDLIRRLHIIKGINNKPTLWEKERYNGWYKLFGNHFYDLKDNIICTNAIPIFTPTAAKVITQYFRSKYN